MIDYGIEDYLVGQTLIEKTQFCSWGPGLAQRASALPQQRGQEAGALVHPVFKYSITVGV